MAKVTAKEQPLLVPEKNRCAGWADSSYEDTYPKVIYDLLCTEWGISKCHIARALGCCKDTVDRWLADFPDFAEAYKKGKSVGESLYRDKVKMNAFSPSKEVNNGLIKMLGKNLYDIGDDVEPVVIIHNTVTAETAEAQLESRGIPVPEVGIDDMEEIDE